MKKYIVALLAMGVSVFCQPLMIPSKADELARRLIPVISKVLNGEVPIYGLVIRPEWVLVPLVTNPYDIHYQINGTQAKPIAFDGWHKLVLVRAKGVGTKIPLLTLAGSQRQPVAVGATVRYLLNGVSIEQPEGKVVTNPPGFFFVSIPQPQYLTGALVYTTTTGQWIFQGMSVGAVARSVTRLPDGRLQGQLTGESLTVTSGEIIAFLRRAENSLTVRTDFPNLKLVPVEQ